ERCQSTCTVVGGDRHQPRNVIGGRVQRRRRQIRSIVAGRGNDHHTGVDRRFDRGTQRRDIVGGTPRQVDHIRARLDRVGDGSHRVVGAAKGTVDELQRQHRHPRGRTGGGRKGRTEGN